MNDNLLKHMNIDHDASPVCGTVVEWLCRGFATFSSEPAVVHQEQRYTYAELNRKSDGIAGLLRDRGVTRGDRVGLCLDRSVEMIACLIGVLKAGAAYVPLDPTYPENRLQSMLADAALSFLLVHDAHTDRFPAEDKLVWEEIEKVCNDAAAVDLISEPNDTAYVIFTSGSTGRPKGIEMPHTALANLIEWQIERASFKLRARVLQYSSISFDVSFQEIATTLASGGTLYLIDDVERRDPRKLLEHLVENKITRLYVPYVAFRSLVEAAEVASNYPQALAEVITAGEQLRVDHAVRRFFKSIPGAVLDNQYGPSETHVITAGLLSGNPDQWPDLPSIGTPLKNCGTCILDEDMKEVPEGKIGELYLAGRNLAKGYLHQPEQNTAAFIQNPFEVSERPVLYRTGDLAAYLSDGSIAFHGRKDNQIKIRGFRVEPGEIDNAVASFEGVGQCVAHAVSGRDHLLQLAAYYTVASGETVDAVALRKYLINHLPEYMVPAFLIELDSIPYTPSGKVDHKALPRPTIEATRYRAHSSEYETDTESKLAEIWNELLGLENIPPTADFFELGGDSLRAVTLFLQIEQIFGRSLSLATLAYSSTIEALAKAIDGEETGRDLSGYRSLKLIQEGSNGVYPLFMVHGGQGNVLLFSRFAHELGPDQPVYAFQWSGWDGGRGEETVEEMARVYCEELIRFHSGGPVRIGGYCIGGLIALELIRLLREAEIEVVGPTVICDSPNLNSSNYCRNEPWDSAESISEFRTMVDQLNELRMPGDEPGDPIPVDYQPPSGMGALIRAVPGAMQVLRMMKSVKDGRKDRKAHKAIASALKEQTLVPMDLRAEYCRSALVKAAKRYRGKPFDGDVIYFRSDCVLGRYFALNGWWKDPLLGFAELCGGQFQAHAVGGSHTEVMSQTELSHLTRKSFG